MSNGPGVLYTYLDKYYYETLDRYEPGDEYRSIAEKHAPSSWIFTPKGFWTYCEPQGTTRLDYGWKIHVSSTIENAETTLDRVVPILIEHDVPFKFASDRKMMNLSFNKNWSRSQVGKFITVYPFGVDHFADLLERIAEKTTDLVGPYVLTDRPYRKSRVVYYRYGEHKSNARSDPYGFRRPGFMINDQWFDDDRTPVFRLPAGIEDPILTAPEVKAPNEKGVLLNSRYQVLGALKFNASGGIYFGVDTHTGMNVVIREARALASKMDSSENGDGYSLRKEADVLIRLQSLECVPRFVELFKAWDNLFLVQERLDAESLWGYSMNFYFNYKNKDGTHKSVDCFNQYRDGMRSIGEALLDVHDCGVVLRDLTRTNVLVTKDGGIKFVDFEFSYIVDDESPYVNGWTPGYGAPEQRSNASPTPLEDVYAFGALMLDSLCYCASGLEIDRSGILARAEQVVADLGLPPGLMSIIKGLMEPEIDERWTIRKALDVLEELEVNDTQRVLLDLNFARVSSPSDAEKKDIVDCIDGIKAHLEGLADFSRQDRLWPASPTVFTTNGINLQCGAAGPAFFFLRSDKQVKSSILDWIDAQAIRGRAPPGLHSGLSGVAMLFQQAGRPDRAAEYMDNISKRDDLYEAHGLYFGAAGLGLANLLMHKATGRELYLERALNIADKLIAMSSTRDTGRYWTTGKRLAVGLGEGQSGVALFFLYLSIASSSSKYLKAGREALAFDIAHKVDLAGKVLWQHYEDSAPGEPNSPHTWFGTSGIGSVALRYHAWTGDTELLELSQKCAASVSTRFTNKLWQYQGLSGFGEYLLDMAAFTGDDIYRNSAFLQAKTLLVHGFRHENGIAFAGLALLRICCDYGFGSSGIGMFLHRLLTRSPRLLTLDDEILARCRDRSLSAMNVAS